MTSSKKLFKHEKNCFQIKTNREMLQHDFHFFGIEWFIFIKMINYSFFIFIFHICAKFQTKTKIYHDDMCIWMFSITVSHFEKITWIFVYDGCLKPFLVKSVSYLIFVSYGLVTKSPGVWGSHMKKWREKIKC